MQAFQCHTEVIDMVGILENILLVIAKEDNQALVFVSVCECDISEGNPAGCDYQLQAYFVQRTGMLP